MITHYLKVAARRLRRPPSSAVVNVLTLALGATEVEHPEPESEHAQ